MYFAAASRRTSSTPDQSMSLWGNYHKSSYTCSHIPQTTMTTTGQTTYGELSLWKLASSHTRNSGSNEPKMLTIQRHTYTWPRNEQQKLPGIYINYAIKQDSKTQPSFPTTLKHSLTSQPQRNFKGAFSWTVRQCNKASGEQERQPSSTQDRF